MDENNGIVPQQSSLPAVPFDVSAEWSAIVNQIVAELNQGDLPDKVIQATEMLIAGYPVHKVAQKVKVTTQTVRRWMSAYPTMAAVVANGRQLLSRWRMAKLEQQFLTAVDRSNDVLEIGLDGFTPEGGRVDPKVLPVVAAQARYIIGLFAAQQQNLTVKHELGDTVMKAHSDALDYIAQRLAEQRSNAEAEPVEATFRVIDSKVDNTGPVLDENGNPPFGKLGELDVNDNGSLCHVCGKRYKDLPHHLLTAHTTTVEEYETLYMLEPGSVRNTGKN